MVCTQRGMALSQKEGGLGTFPVHSSQKGKNQKAKKETVDAVSDWLTGLLLTPPTPVCWPFLTLSHSGNAPPSCPISRLISACSPAELSCLMDNTDCLPRNYKVERESSLLLSGRKHQTTHRELSSSSPPRSFVYTRQ